MKKQVRNLIASLAVLALLCGAWLVLKVTPKTDPALPAQEETLPSFAGSVEGVRIVRAGETLDLTRDGVEGVDERIVDADRVASALAALNSVSPDSLVEASPKDAAVYGFDGSETNASVSYGDGNTLEIRLGARESVSGGTYCRFNDAKEIYLLNEQTASVLTQPANAYLSLRIMPECLAANALSAVGDFELERKDGKITIHAVRDGRYSKEALSFGAVSHLIEGPDVLHELDRTEGERLFQSLFALQAREIVGLGLSDEEMSALGFDAPDAVARYSLFNGDDPQTSEEKQTLSVVAEDANSVLITANDSGVVYRADRPSFLDADYARLVLRQFVSPLMADVARLEIGANGETHVYEISGTLKEPVVTCGGKNVDAAEFRRFYTLAVSAASNGEACEFDAEGVEPVLTIRYVYRDAEKEDDFLEFYPTDARVLFVTLNGVGEFAMRQRFAEVVQNAISSLEAGVSIETNW